MDACCDTKAEELNTLRDKHRKVLIPIKLLTAIQEHAKPGGRAIVNVLIEGTTYLGMFDPDNYCLFRRNELEERFDGWSILESRYQTFPAPEGTRKDFATIVAEKAS